MVKVFLGFCLFFLGFFLTFIPPFIWGPLLIMSGVGLVAAGFASMGISLTKFAVRSARKASQDTRAEPSMQPVLAVPQAAPQTEAAKPYDVARWTALVEYDPELREARDRLAAYGGAYVERLAKDFLAVNDRQYLPAMVSRIEAQAIADLDSKNAMPIKNGTYLGLSWWEYGDGAVVASFGDEDRTFPTMQDFMAAASGATR